jgi:hypothetical protein
MLRIIFVILLTIFSLSGCRYWSLYKFADQFCEFDEHVRVNLEKGASRINFLEPVLPRKILLRYLNAKPFVSIEDVAVGGVREDLFRIQRASVGQHDYFGFKLSYHGVGKTRVLASGLLDQHLSALFVPGLIEPILQSVCSDDYDLSLKRLDMRFTLTGIQHQYLPDKLTLLAAFGEADLVEGSDNSGQTLHYQFDFLTEPKAGNNHRELQHSPIEFAFGFDQNSQLMTLHILYFKYDYWLDFQNENGRLIVIRKQ